MKKDLMLNIYDENGEVKKTCSADFIDLEFGTIRKIMELLDIEDVDDSAGIFRKIYGAWDELTRILSKCFKDMEYDDWEHVRLSELFPLLIKIFKYSFQQIMTIPGDSKN